MKAGLWIGAMIAAALIAIGGLSYLYVRARQAEAPQCNVCRRPIPLQTAFAVLVGRREVWYCCPRCWVSAQRAGKSDYRRPMATDYTSREMFPAERCIYVEGSDLMPCCAPDMTIGNAGVPAVQCFDRCFPSVVAFASPEEALRFSKEHGGAILSFQTLADEARKP